MYEELTDSLRAQGLTDEQVSAVRGIFKAGAALREVPSSAG